MPSAGNIHVLAENHCARETNTILHVVSLLQPAPVPSQLAAGCQVHGSANQQLWFFGANLGGIRMLLQQIKFKRVRMHRVKHVAVVFPRRYPIAFRREHTDVRHSCQHHQQNPGVSRRDGADRTRRVHNFVICSVAVAPSPPPPGNAPR